MLEAKPSVHAATEDCTSCHEVTVGDEGTTVALAQGDPGLCVECHSDLEPAVAGDLEHPHPPLADGCLECHSPHASDFPRLLVAAQAEVCANCHGGEAFEAAHDGLLTAGVTCTSCHRPHGGDQEKLLVGAVQHPPFADRSCAACHRPSLGGRIRLLARGKRLCLACHDDPASVANAESVHPALADDPRGRAGCVACHDPHLSQRPRMLRAAGPALCADCHEGVVRSARAATGHAAADDDCANCHLPHASEQRRLLASPVAELCAECHDVADADLSARHLGADLATLRCVACHSPHGTGNASLLEANLHPPLLDGCDTCHQGSWNHLEDDGEAPLCLGCHSEIGERAEAAAVPHGAMEMGSCTPCHNPHASREPKLLRSPPASACAECHDDQLAGDGEVAHGVITAIGCQACHEPHGGERPSLLRAEGAELCLACHGRAAGEQIAAGIPLRVFDRIEVPLEVARGLPILRLSANGERNHPVTGHRVLGRVTEQETARSGARFEGELTCLTCHNPHKGRSALLLQWNAATPAEACSRCHQK